MREGRPARPGLRLDLDPQVAVRLQADAALRLARGAQEARYAADPWIFLSEAVWTLDQRGSGGGIRPYPGTRLVDPSPTCPCSLGGCINYLEHLVRVWQGSTRLLVPKSRRLLITWTFVALYYWMARYQPARMIAFGARKRGETEDEGSAELVKRAKFIHDHLPATCAPRKIRYGFARLTFLDNNSTILGIAEGADQARQYTFSDYFADEFAFWDKASETTGALLPTLEGGGRFVGVSSAAPGHMEHLVFDRWQVHA